MKKEFRKISLMVVASLMAISILQCVWVWRLYRGAVADFVQRVEYAAYKSMYQAFFYGEVPGLRPVTRINIDLDAFSLYFEPTLLEYNVLQPYAVEVVRGGGSALFGANAVGGTVNIITKDPVSNSFSVTSNLACYGGDAWEQSVGANASLVSKDNKYGIALYENYRNRNPYDHDGDGFSELGKVNINTFGLRAFYRPTYTSRLSLEYHTTNELRRGGNKFDYQPHESDITEQTEHVINSGGVTYDIGWLGYKHKLSLFASVQHVDRNSYYGAQRDPNAYGKTDDLTWITGATYTGSMDNCLFSPATFTGGIEYQENKLHDIMTGYNRDMKQNVRIASAFAQNEWNMNLFSLLVGLRLDKHNLIDNPIFSPRVNLLFKPNRDFQARLTYSTGFRAPQAYDEDLHVTAVGGEGVQIALADNLKEERSNSYSGSIDWTTNLYYQYHHLAVWCI